MVEKTGLEAELNVPDHIMVPSGANSVDVDVLASLRNHSEDGHVVHVPDSDGVHFWQLLDANHKEVQRAPATKGKGLENARCELIASGHALAEPQTISLDAKKLKDGRCYTLRYVLWGEHAAEGRINVSHAPAKAAKAKAAKGKAARAKKK